MSLTIANLLADFYAPPVVAAALIALRKLADVTAVPLGGYPQAERCRLCLGNADALTGTAADPEEVSPQPTWSWCCDATCRSKVQDWRADWQLAGSFHVKYSVAAWGGFLPDWLNLCSMFMHQKPAR